MAYVAPKRVTQSIEGVSLSTVYDAVTTATPEYPGTQFIPGATATASDGSKWIYVKFTGVVTQYDVVMIDSSWNALSIIGGAAAAVPSQMIGFHQNATTSANQTGWVMISGAPTMRAAGSVVKNVQLYTTNTSGVLDDAVVTGSQFPIRGVYFLTTNPSATATTNVAMASFPTVGPITTL